ncbi:MAG: DUF805 domain-containing protein [Alkalicoccus sp.]|nr:MAG: DUF805 domain-containing protein [Alkalicoccus sp.]
MEWYLKVLQNFGDFQSRARRKEYWMFVLVNFLILMVLSILETLIGLPAAISSLYSLVVLIPGIAVAVRRMHDTNKSGWWVLILLVPFIGWIIFLIFAVQDSEAGANRFGPNPKVQPAA